MIGQSTRVEERASIKRSIIGPHCVIGKMAKIVGCVLLDHCVVADGQVHREQTMEAHISDFDCRAKLDGCVLGRSTKVGSKAELVRCVTQAGYEVEAAGEFRRPRTSEVSAT
jgi:translation initiation factor eIF-2B subunit gamma